MKYRKIFDPKSMEIFTDAPKRKTAKADSRDISIYVYNDEIVLAVNAALATGRPILVRGASGTGKSSLARNVAKVLRWRYYDRTISSRTQARDLLWEVDHLRRLQDAQAKKLSRDFSQYLIPGVLWWAFDQESAQQRGAPSNPRPKTKTLVDPGEGYKGAAAVVLLDEIDKADPDVPNNLLVPLGSLTFQVEETGYRVTARKVPMIILTTNDERELPPAFLRRCIELNLHPPNKEDLIKIGLAHFSEQQENILNQIAEFMLNLNGTSGLSMNQMPSTAEYLDTVRACIELGVKPGSFTWDYLSKITLSKQSRFSS